MELFLNKNFRKRKNMKISKIKIKFLDDIKLGKK